ncbi:hypothetical protein CHISP_1178 [Chitinispirillum alkaliphilum]|nr:hypothetical protein CHISP_1178 [Chitinispirillum alkaliphilum]
MVTLVVQNKNRSQTSHLLFRTIGAQEISVQPLINDLNNSTALSAGDLRQIVIGHGLNKFPYPDSQSAQKLLSVLRDHKVEAIMVPAPKPGTEVLAANSAVLNTTSVELFNSRKEPVLKIDADSKLFFVISDVSGKDQTRRVFRAAHGGSRYSDLESLLRSLAFHDPVVDIYCKEKNTQVIRIDPRRFAWLSLGSKLTHSRGTNLSVLLKEITSVCKSWHYDDYFGLSDLSNRNIKGMNRNRVLSHLTDYGTLVATASHHDLLANSNTPNIATEQVAAAKSTDHRTERKSKTLQDLLRRPSPPPPMESFWFDTNILSRIAVIILPVMSVSFLKIFTGLLIQSRVVGAVFGAIALIASGFLLARSLYFVKCKRMIQNTPTSKIRSASIGLVELTGKAECKFNLKTPFTLVPCLYYQCRVYRRNYSQNDGPRWKLTRSYSSGKLPFYLTDDTGRILVQPSKAMFCRSQLKREIVNGNGSAFSAVDRDTKVETDFIPEGGSVYLLGFRYRKWQKKSVQERVRERLHALEYNKSELVRYDTNGNNRLDHDELLRAAAQIETEIRAPSRTLTPGRDIMIGNSPHGKTPLIVSGSEKDLIKRLSTDSLIYLISGFLLLAFTIKVFVSFA